MNKLNHLLTSWPKNAIYLSAWLQSRGYSNQLLLKYKKSNWISSIGSGAVFKQGDTPTIEGALYALQKQGEFKIHIGAKTALNLLGKAQYLEFNNQNYYLFESNTHSLPKWFTNRKWISGFKIIKNSILPVNLGLIEIDFGSFKLMISGAARAIMECLFLSPKNQDLIECYQIMENLNNLHPKIVQELLENCTSVKVNRLFLFLAKKAGHVWYNNLDLEKINLGEGKRKIVDNGIYIPEFKITVPKILVNGEL